MGSVGVRAGPGYEAIAALGLGYCLDPKAEAITVL
jgi:hypothetical protein